MVEFARASGVLYVSILWNFTLPALNPGEGRKLRHLGLHKTFLGTTTECENKNSGWKGLRPKMLTKKHEHCQG